MSDECFRTVQGPRISSSPTGRASNVPSSSQCFLLGLALATGKTAESFAVTSTSLLESLSLQVCLSRALECRELKLLSEEPLMSSDSPLAEAWCRMCLNVTAPQTDREIRSLSVLGI